MTEILELFGYSVDESLNWQDVVLNKKCAFCSKKCYKTRKSSPDTAIGTCSINWGKKIEQSLVICPERFLERGQIFLDCIHLLTIHEPGNQLHVVPEVQIPGGHVDYFLVSVKSGQVVDFVGMEIQALDTTGSLWGIRQNLCSTLGIPTEHSNIEQYNFGINWKMTAKTILMQMHHKIKTFENINRKLVLVLQNKLLEYMEKEFRFEHLRSQPSISDSLHIHAYNFSKNIAWHLDLDKRLSTNANGIAECLNLNKDPEVDLEEIITILQGKISSSTIFQIREC